MQVIAKKSTEKQERQPKPEATPEHDALIREVAEDARREPERFLADSIVREGGE
jgi:transposase